MTLFMPIACFVSGVLLLGFGAHCFVKSSCQIADRFHMPALIAGIVLVGFGGSFPEIVVSYIAASHGQTSMAVGNAIGSNSVNLGLVLGVSVLLAPITVNRLTLTRDFPLLWIVMFVIGGILLVTHRLSVWLGVLLLLGLVAYLTIMILSTKKQPKAAVLAVLPPPSKQVPLWRSGVLWLVGLALLFVSSELMVSNATLLAQHFGMSTLLIGLTIVAIGTSLPEFATTAISAVKGHHDIALGNILGSNVFNLLAVLAMPALLSPAAISRTVMTRDYPVMCLLTLIAMIGAWYPRGSYQIGRWTGFVLLLVWLGYYWLLF